MGKRRDRSGGVEAQPPASTMTSAMVRCMRCDQDKPSAGARPFRSLMVCAECTRQVINAAAQKGQAQRATTS